MLFILLTHYRNLFIQNKGFILTSKYLLLLCYNSSYIILKGVYMSNKIKKYSKIIKSLILGAFIGLFLAVFIIKSLSPYIESESGLLFIFKIYALIGAVFFFYLVHIIIHESGHLIFGLLTGYTFVSFRIASITLIKENNKFKIKKFSIPGTAGQCLMMPPELKGGKYPFIIYNLGGGLMNLLISFASILIIIITENRVSTLNLILTLESIAGIIAGLTNIIPLKVGGVANDGYNVLSMLKDEYARYGFYAQLKTYALLTKGYRMKDIPFKDIECKEGVDLSNPLVASLKLLEHSWYLDNMHFNKAQICLNSFNSVSDYLIPIIKYEINCEKIFLELIGDCNKGVVDKLYDDSLKKYIKASKFSISKKRFLMAYEAFYEKDLDKALKYFKEGEALALKYPVKGEAEMELMLMNWIKNSIIERT